MDVLLVTVVAVIGWWLGQWLPVIGGWLIREQVTNDHPRAHFGSRIGLALGAAIMVGLVKNLEEALLAFALLLFLSLAVWTDRVRGIIPNRLNGIGAAVFILLQGIRGEPWTPLLVASLAGFCLLGAVSLLSGGGMGGGDVKMAAAAGWALGWPALGTGLALSIISGGITALWLWMRKRVEGKTPIPFGPHLALGFFIAFWFGEELAGWYLSLLRP